MNSTRHRMKPGLLMFSLIPVGLALTMLGGCETLQGIVDSSPRPSANITAARLSDLSLDQVTLDFDVEIENPYSVALPLTDLTYSIASGGDAFLSGAAPIAGSVPARGSKTITMPARISFAEVLNIVAGVRPGAVVPYTADLDLSVDAPGVGVMNLPLKQKGELPVPAVPSVKLESVDWENLSLRSASALLKIRIENTNSFPIDLAGFDYGLSLAGADVIDAKLRNAASLAPGEGAVLEIPISVSPSDLGMSAFRMLTGDGAGYTLGGSMDASTPFGPITLPFNVTGQTPFTH
jgi:LEA14-like dessication related protein